MLKTIIIALLQITYVLCFQDFDSKFERGECPGWAREHHGAMAHTGAHLDLSAFSSPEELGTLGLDRLKSALMALGLKCGGTLQVSQQLQLLSVQKNIFRQEVSITYAKTYNDIKILLRRYLYMDRLFDHSALL